MNALTLWQRYQDWLYYHDGLEFYLDISRMGVSEAFVESLKPKFDKAFQDMETLEAGGIANPDEGRMVGHYWLRNPEIAPTAAIKQEIIETPDDIEIFARQVHTGAIKPPQAPKFTDILSIGIGGSALGPQFVSAALAPEFPPLNLYFIDNSDPAGIERTLNQLQQRLNTTLVLVVSKSGGTPEPSNGMLEVKHAYESKGLNFAAHAVAVTMAGSKLDGIAKSDNWLAIFPMFDWVGGRTSEMSAVGLVPAMLQGIDMRQLLEGAKLMDEATRSQDIKQNPAALLALSWYYSGNGKGEKDMVILPYKDSLLLFSRYLQQLVMESLGKALDLDGKIVNQGLAVYGNKGSTDQHAYVQQLREGVSNFFVTFIEVLKDKEGSLLELEPQITSGDYLSGFLQGTRQALYENQRESITLTIPEVNPRTVGALIALYERTVSFYASLVNINAYHQPGVEAGKKAGASILKLQQAVLQVLKNAGEPLDLTTLANRAGASEEIEAIYKIIRHLAANNRGIILTGDRTKPTTLKISMQ
jgi:glucose-6-phosphate isomerase